MALKPAYVEGAANGLACTTSSLSLGADSRQSLVQRRDVKAEQTQEQRRVSPISCAPPAAHPPIRSSNYEPH
jgi:hypothetical protein